jgi:hypothetical protein
MSKEKSVYVWPGEEGKVVWLDGHWPADPIKLVSGCLLSSKEEREVVSLPILKFARRIEWFKER